MGEQRHSSLKNCAGEKGMPKTAETPTKKAPLAFQSWENLLISRDRVFISSVPHESSEIEPV
jgi:hypothetical protein